VTIWLAALLADIAAADALFAQAAAVRAADWQAAEALADSGEAVYERLEDECSQA
jgi:hypothetical protein